MRVRHPSDRSGMKVLIFTTNRGNIYRPDKNGSVGTNTFVKEWLAGKIFVLCCGKGKKFEEIMPYIESGHGSLDYDFWEKK